MDIILVIPTMPSIENFGVYKNCYISKHVIYVGDLFYLLSNGLYGGKLFLYLKFWGRFVYYLPMKEEQA
jgi:hypothetical protein